VLVKIAHSTSQHSQRNSVLLN